MRNVNLFILSCDVFGRPRAPNPKHKAVGLVRVGAPMEQLGIDIIGGGTFPKTRKGFKYILSIIAHFTKWAVAVPMKDQTTDSCTSSTGKVGQNLRGPYDDSIRPKASVCVRGFTCPLPTPTNPQIANDPLSTAVKWDNSVSIGPSKRCWQILPITIHRTGTCIRLQS